MIISKVACHKSYKQHCTDLAAYATETVHVIDHVLRQKYVSTYKFYRVIDFNEILIKSLLAMYFFFRFHFLTVLLWWNR